MRTFHLLRNGLGVVAEGVMFSNGKCIMLWLSEPGSIAYFDSPDELEEIHGHGGQTRMVFKPEGGKDADHSRNDQN